jgi:hypothetical protein
MYRSNAASLNYLVGAGQKHRRDFEPRVLEVIGEVGATIALRRFLVHTRVYRPAELAQEPDSAWRGSRLLSGVGGQIGREGEINLRFDSRETASRNGSSPTVGCSEPEAKANRGIDRVPMEVAVRQAAIDL